MRIIKASALCTVAAVALATSAPVLAHTPPTATIVGTFDDPDVLTERVSYADLNLASATGEKRLLYRVSRAVRNVCPGYSLSFTLLEHRCRDFAWTGAKPQIDLAVRRAREIAANGFSAIAPVTIAIRLPR